MPLRPAQIMALQLEAGLLRQFHKHHTSLSRVATDWAACSMISSTMPALKMSHSNLYMPAMMA